MHEVQSNTSQVTTIINEMESVRNAISGINQNITFATRTTVSGNAVAKTTINEHKSLVNQFMNAFRQDIERLQTIATEFNQTDIEASHMYERMF